MTIKAKIGVNFNFDTNANNVLGNFKSLWDYCKFLESEGITQEIARNNGSGGTGTGWPDDSSKFGPNCWSVFKWVTSSTRTWEWYMYIQGIAGVTPSASPANPALVNNVNNSIAALAYSAAISVSGSISENPWGGTTGSLGSDTKGNPVWVSSSNDYNLHVFPRSNSSGGAHAVSRQSLGLLSSPNPVAGEEVYFNVASDDNSMVIVRSLRGTADIDVNAISYLGTYTPAYSALSQAISTPFITFNHVTSTDRLFTNTVAPSVQAQINYGLKSGAGNNREGGIVGVTGVRTVTFDYPANPGLAASIDYNSSLHPNQVMENVNLDFYSRYLTLPIPVFASNVDDDRGFLGFIDNSLIKQAIHTPNYFSNIDSSRISVWATNASDPTIDSMVPNAALIPWKLGINPRDVGPNLRDGLFQGEIE